MEENRTPAGPEVVVGADGTTTAEQAITWAAAEARRRGLPLRIVHAAPYATGPEGRRRAAAILARAYTVARRREPTVSAHTRLLADDPVPALVREGGDAALLVLGMVGEQRLDEVVVGSVALAVSGQASCPVTVVHGLLPPPAAELPVLLGLEDVAADASAVSFAFADAARAATPLQVLHTRRPLQGRGEDPDADIAASLHRQLTPWRERHPGVAVQLRVVRGAAAEELLQATAGARMVVLGTHSRGGAARAVLGSAGRTLVRRSPCPVTVVRPDPATAAPAPGEPVAAATQPEPPAELAGPAPL